MQTKQDKKAKNRQLVITLGYIFVHFNPIIPIILFIKEPFSVRYWPIRFENLYKNLPIIQYIAVAFGMFFEIIAATFSVYPASFIIALLIIYFGKLKFWLMQINKRLAIRAIRDLIQKLQNS